MKHCIAALLSCLAISFCSATHFREVDITHKLLDAASYHFEVTVTTYTRTSSFAADVTSVEVNWGDGNVDLLHRVNGPIDSAGNHRGEECHNDIKKSVYKGTHFYAGIPPTGHYLLSFYAYNRMNSINNIESGSSVNVPLYIEDTLFIGNVVAAGVNSSPEFLYCGADYANVNDTFIYNPVTHDADGDSLVFELVTPLRESGVTVSLYAFPQQYCQALGNTNNNFEINASTGAIKWNTPCQIGIFNIAFRVKEYRCGVLLSTVMRDMQLIVLNENNEAPQISVVSDAVIQPGETVAFTVTASDPNVADVVSLEIMGGSFVAAQDTPVVVSVSGNPASATFTWQTGSASAKKQPYIFSVVATDNYSPTGFSTHQTFTVSVTDTSTCAVINSAEDVTESIAVAVYPNPTHHNWQLSVSDNVIGSTLEVFDTEGRMVFQSAIANPQSAINFNAARGIYLLRIVSANHTTTRKLIKL